MRGSPRIGSGEGSDGTCIRAAMRLRSACSVRRWLAVPCLVTLAGCSDTPLTAPVPDQLVIVAPTPASRLSIGETAMLRAEVLSRGARVPDARVVWSSRDPGIAAVGPDGTITAVARGNAEIAGVVAGLPEVRAGIILSVVGASSILVDTRAITLEEGAQRRLRATVTLDPGATSPPVVWRSSAPTVALVDNQGLVTGLTPGNAVIRASALGLTDSALVTVVPQPVGTIVIDQATGAFLIGDQRQFTATLRNAANTVLPGRTVAWTTAHPAVATVSPAGLLTAVGAGTTTLSAESGGKIASLPITVRFPVASITVSPASPRIPRGSTQALTAQVRNARDSVLADRSVSWTSSAPTIATVSATGVVTGVGNGTVSITASAEGITGTVTVTVVEPVTAVQVTPATATLLVGGTQQLSAAARDAKGAALTGRPVTWSSSNPSVATVSGTGLVTAVGAGSATLTARVEGVEGSVTVTVAPLPAALTAVSVSPNRVTLSAGQTRELVSTVAQPTGAPSATVTFGTTAPTVATVSPDGVMTAVAPGTATLTVTATAAGTAGFAAATVTATVAVTVIPAVSTVRITPDSATILVGRTRQLTVAARDPSGAVLTGRAVTWSTSDAAVATVSATGLVTTVAIGTVTITATVEGVEGMAALTVAPLPAAVSGVAVTPSTVSLIAGRTRLLEPTVNQPAGAPPASLTYGSTAPTVATVSAAGVITAVGPGTATITVTAASAGNTSFQPASASTTVTVTVVAAVATVQVTPAAATVLVGGTQQLTAAARDAKGAALTGRAVTWSTSDAAVATGSATGLVTAVGVGSATLTALVEGVEGTVAVTVVPLPAALTGVTVSPTRVTVSAGQTRELIATVAQPAGAPVAAVTFGTTAPTVATVSPEGVMTAVAPGTATITVTATATGTAGFAAATATATVVVTVVPAAGSVQVTPDTATLLVGRSRQLTVSVRDQSGALLTGRAVTWSTSDAAVATVSATGLVTAVAIGTVSITATVEGVEGMAALTVSPLPAAVSGVAVTPSPVSLFVGRTRALSATVTQPTGAPAATVTYGSTAPTVATVSAAGVITAVGSGTATITVTATVPAAAAGTAGFSAATETATVDVTVTPVPVASVQVTPATTNLIVGGTQQMASTVRDSVGAPLTGRVVSWSSSNTAVATVNATGLVTAVATGTAMLTATVEGATGTALVAVGPLPAAITTMTVSSATQSLLVGQTRAVAPVVSQPSGAPTAGVTYGTTAPSVATVSANGVITAVAPGTATITATATAAGNTNFSAATTTVSVAVTVLAAVASVQITPATATLTAGNTQQLTATVRDSAGTTLTGRSVTWSTSSAAVATVNATGLVTAVAVGTVTVTATSGGVSGTASVTVSPLAPAVTDLTVTPSPVSLLAGRTQALTPTVTQPVGATAAVVTYGTTAPSVATVTVNGIVTGVAPGTATITVTATATGNTGFSAATRSAAVIVTVAPVAVASVQVAPATASLLAGSTQQLVVTARDSTGQALTGRTVSWATLNAAAATVNASGLVTGVSVGSATITATVEGVVGTASLTVLPAPPSVTAVTVSPTTVSLGAGQTQSLAPTVTQPTGATAATVTYGTTDPAVATVSVAGVITGVAPGTATITVTASAPGSATYSAASSSTTVAVTVLPPAINGVTVSPTSATIAVGLTQALTPTVTQPVGAATASVTYSSSVPGVATVSATGVVTAVASGTATITVTATAAANASYSGTTVSTTVTITVP